MRSLLLLSLFSLPLFAAQPIDQQTLLDWQQKEAVALLLDVRPAADFAKGHIPGAQNLAYEELTTRLGELNKYQQQTVVVYCNSGRKATLAEDEMEKAGFAKVYHLSGDWQAWTKAGQSVETTK